eukprot:CAMPEP_0176104248 /NCGR_PEP_ID=MMETSP0120_2-20121206/52309_1 /TAXON_ID=160619 /ORGANISM="Kryptoperidinium foliaceum, Strain CCMP 1326" /LENGTH=209 /DNA_ID=CAMNT_0017438351 /DNA_START=127 /DNA_END=752 /DNA_ORIENTATION=+
MQGLGVVTAGTRRGMDASVVPPGGAETVGRRSPQISAVPRLVCARTGCRFKLPTFVSPAWRCVARRRRLHGADGRHVCPRAGRPQAVSRLTLQRCQSDSAAQLIAAAPGAGTGLGQAQSTAGPPNLSHGPEAMRRRPRGVGCALSVGAWARRTSPHCVAAAAATETPFWRSLVLGELRQLLLLEGGVVGASAPGSDMAPQTAAGTGTSL